MKDEIWLPVVGHEVSYSVSNVGRVKTNYRLRLDSKLRRRVRKEKILKTQKDKAGYMHVCLCENGNKKIYLVHRLVADAFIKNNSGKRCVNHIDGNKSNNHVENLEWNTHKENTIHSFEKLGRKAKPAKRIYGKDNPRSKQIRVYKGGVLLETVFSVREASRFSGVSTSRIGYVMREDKSAKGYYFKNIGLAEGTNNY